MSSSSTTGLPTPEGPGSVAGTPKPAAAIADTSISLVPNGGSVLREGYAEVGDDVRLHYVEAGDGPLVVLLHGFRSGSGAFVVEAEAGRLQLSLQ